MVSVEGAGTDAEAAGGVLGEAAGGHAAQENSVHLRGKGFFVTADSFFKLGEAFFCKKKAST